MNQFIIYKARLHQRHLLEADSLNKHQHTCILDFMSQKCSIN